MQNKLAIPVWWLYLVHAIVPLLFAVLLIDWWFLDNAWQPYLQWNLTTLGIYLLVFELPHIVASFFSYADKEYVQHYRKRLLLVPIIIVVGLSLFWYNFFLAYVLYAFLTMYHVTRQQTGITAMLLKRSSLLHHTWSWLMIIAYTYGLLMVFETTQYSGDVIVNQTVLNLVVTLFLFVTLWYAAVMRGVSREGWWYFVMTSVVALCAFLFMGLGYGFLAILAVRFVHDITAFIFYTVHDVNRNRDVTHNIIYQYLVPLGLPQLIVTPIGAIVLAATLRYGLEVLGYATVILFTFGFVHYYLEGFMWKRDSLHRQHISIARPAT